MLASHRRHYGDESEGELGAWIEARGVREQVVLVGKGAHTPFCAPEHVGPQLERSLELLRTDSVDLATSSGNGAPGSSPHGGASRPSRSRSPGCSRSPSRPWRSSARATAPSSRPAWLPVRSS